MSYKKSRAQRFNLPLHRRRSLDAVGGAERLNVAAPMSASFHLMSQRDPNNPLCLSRVDSTCALANPLLPSHPNLLLVGVRT
jgi:hypothetical protein